MKKLVLAVLAALALAAPQAASAAIVPLDPTAGGTSTAVGEALMSDPAQLSSAQLPEYSDGGFEDPFPIGIGDTSGAPASLAGFPTDSSSYAILSTGDVATIGEQLANEASNTSSSFIDQIPDEEARGPGAREWTVLRLDVVVPDGMNCLSLDYRFLSEEFPEFVGSNYNDAFIAELNGTSWGIESGGAIFRPNDFAVDPAGTAISVNGVGPASVNAEQAVGTYFDAATGLVTTKRAVGAGLQTVYLSIVDAGDSVYDSAVFIDNLRFINESPATCKPPVGALLVIPAPGAPPPSNAFGVGPRVKFKRGNTEVVITITVPGPGLLEAGSPGPAGASSAPIDRAAAAKASAKKGKAKGKKRPPLVRTTARAKQAGPVKIGVRLSGAGKARLAKTGKLTLPVELTFTPDGGSPSVQTKKVTFKSPGKGKKKGKKGGRK
jgi:hypothetical protein